jgi:hypothetical protein
MAASSGYNPRIIENYTKITDLNMLQPGKNYLVTYFYGKPRQHHIAKFREVRQEDGEPTYFFHSLYTKRPRDTAPWITIGDPDYMPVHIGFDDQTIRIKPIDFSASEDPNDASKFFSVYELGPHGDLISELLRPEDVNSNVRGHTRLSLEPKTNPDAVYEIMGFLGKQGGYTRTNTKTNRNKRTNKKTNKRTNTKRNKRTNTKGNKRTNKK